MEAEKKKRQHFDFKDIEIYIRSQKYPSFIQEKNDGTKSNFRKASKNFMYMNI